MKSRFKYSDNRLIIILFFVSIFMLTGCREKKGKCDIHVNEIPLKVTIHRFDRDFAMLKPDSLQQELPLLKNKYGNYLNFYLSKALTFPGKSMQDISQLKQFLSDTTVQSVFKECAHHYSNISDIEATVTDAFKRVRHFFPDKKIPELYFHISMFNQSLIVDSGLISLSIDNYLGDNYLLYKRMGIYDYLLPNMCRAKIPSDFITVFLLTEFPMPASDRLLENMIYRGKILYMLSALMPQEADTTLMGYSKAQWEWCAAHEKDIWLAIMDNKHLYSSDRMIVTAYIGDAPFTSTISQDSPGRLGHWIGWQIVNSYMKRYPDVTLQQLAADTKYQQLLEQSGYKP